LTVVHTMDLGTMQHYYVTERQGYLLSTGRQWSTAQNMNCFVNYESNVMLFYLSKIFFIDKYWILSIYTRF